MDTQTIEPTKVNGFDTSALGGLVDLLKAHPEGGRVTFRSHSAWQEGALVTNTVRGYRIDGRLHHEQARHFTVRIDEPAEFGATDTATAPPEMLLHAIGSCIAATANAYAALKGVELRHIEVDFEGDLDLHGMFALDGRVRPGLSETRASIRIAGNADERTLYEIARLGYDYSLVRDTVEKGVPMQPQITIG